MMSRALVPGTTVLDGAPGGAAVVVDGDEARGGHGQPPPALAAGSTAGFGHGKVILLGEHAVVYGQPAIAAGLSRGIWAQAKPGTGKLSAPTWAAQAQAGDGTPLGQAFQAVLSHLRISAVDVELGGDLPPRAGLGSSAAVGIALGAAITQLAGRDRADALQAAAQAEIVFHGTPSGIDLAAAASGQVGCFRRTTGWQPIEVLQPMTLCVGLSGLERDTRAQVEAVRRLRDRTPTVQSVIAALGEVAQAGQGALERGDIDDLGRLFDLAHGLLASLRVSCLALETLVHEARAAGAIGAKLTGAGGGGAVIALAPGHERDVLARWRAAGYAGFLAQIGAAQPAYLDHPLARQAASAGHHSGAATAAMSGPASPGTSGTAVTSAGGDRSAVTP